MGERETASVSTVQGHSELETVVLFGENLKKKSSAFEFFGDQNS